MKNNSEVIGNLPLSPSPNDTSPEALNITHRLLDAVTYSFCVIGILLNFFAFGILRRKATMGVLLIKLILISDGLVCVFYLLNQIWIDFTINYLLTTRFTDYLSRKPLLSYVSSIFRILAVATVSVSNWYVVIMIAHRCISIYVTPMRSHLDRSLWIFVQKQMNLWIAYALCWILSIMITTILLNNYQILLEILIYVLPLVLVFIFSVCLLVKLHTIQQKSEYSPKATSCCVSPYRANKSTQKTDSDETFGQPKHVERLSSTPEGLRKRLSTAMMQDLYSLNSRSIDKSKEVVRKKTYYRITMTILSLATSFLILDSLQLLDLLIRIPWVKIMGNFEEAHVNDSITQANSTSMDEFLTEVQKSDEKQSVLSIVKNTCALGKTLVNFLILCAHSRHFRALVTVKFQRIRRFLRLSRRGMQSRFSRRGNAGVEENNILFAMSSRRNTIHRRRPELQKNDVPNIHQVSRLSFHGKPKRNMSSRSDPESNSSRSEHFLYFVRK